MGKCTSRHLFSYGGLSRAVRGKAHNKQNHQEDRNIEGLKTPITFQHMIISQNRILITSLKIRFFNFELARAASAYQFDPRPSRVFPLVSLGPGGVGPQPKNSHYSRDHPVPVLVDVLASLDRLRCLPPDDSEGMQIDNQQIKNKPSTHLAFSKSQTTKNP